MYLQSANLIPGDSSFETGYGIWDKTGEIVKMETVNGSCALRLESVIRSAMLFDLKPGTPHVFSVWLKAEKPDSPLMLQLYRRNWDGRNITKHVRVGTEWARYELAVPPQAFGDYNKFQLVIAPQKKGAAIFADAVQLEMAEKASDYVSAEQLPFVCEVVCPVPGHMYLEGEDPEFSFRVFNSQKERSVATIELSVTDYYGKTVLNRVEKLAIEPGVTLERVYKLFAPEKKGFYRVDYALTGPNGRQERKGSFCVLAHPLKRPEGTRALFGLCSVRSSSAEMAARMGVQTAALTYRWSYLKENGELDFIESMDRAINTLHEKGIDVNLYMRRTPPFAAMKKSSTDSYPPKEEFVPGYEDFAYKLASRYKGKVRSYQIWGGEADGTEKLAVKLGKDHAWFLNLLAELTKYGYKGIKRGDPDALVDTSAVCGTDCENSRFAFQSELLAKIGGYYDRVVIHPYCYPWAFDGTKYVQSPEQADLPRKYHTISKIAGGKRVVNGEYGFAISSKENYDSPASRRRAAYMARSILLTALCPEVDHIMYYTIADGDARTIINWPNPYPDAAAYSALARQLCGAVSPEELVLSSLVKACSFTVPDGGVAAIWVPSDKEIEFAVPATVGNVRAFDIMGNEFSAKDTIRLSGAPVYLRSPDGQDAVKRFLREGKLMIQPLSLEIRAADDKTLTIYAVNQLMKELTGTITIRVPVIGGEVKEFTKSFSRLRTSGITETLTLEIPGGIDFQALNAGTEITADVKTDEGNMTYSQKLEVLPCPKLSAEPEINGDLSKWEKLPCIELKTMDYLFPPDAFSHGTWTSAADLSIKAWVAWDDKYFYFAARVMDDVFVNPGDASDLWRGDCIQMAFDPANDARGPGFRRDEVEINLAYSDKVKATVMSQSWPLPVRFPKSVRTVVKPGEGCICYEAAIPFSMLPPLEAKAGRVFGFNFTALDNDLKKVDYWMGLTYGICGGKNASLFKKFILIEGENQK